MEKYDYLSAVTADVKDYINDNVDFADYENADELKEKLQDELWTVDRVTGNGSGSYTFSTWKAEENICHNSELIAEVEEEWGTLKRDNPEGIDVAIRCYLLPQAIDAAVGELWEDKEGRCPSNNHPPAVTDRKASGARPHTAQTLKHYRYDNISTRDLLCRLQICALLFQQH